MRLANGQVAREDWTFPPGYGDYTCYQNPQQYGRWPEAEAANFAGPSSFNTYYSNQRMNFLIVDSPQRKQSVWTEFVSNDGQLYFFNKVTKQSFWEKPYELKSPVERLLSSEWQEYQFSDGSVYFYNTLTNETTWDFPYDIQSLKPDEASAHEDKGNSGEPCPLSSPRKRNLSPTPLNVNESKENKREQSDIKKEATAPDRGDRKKES